MSSQSSNSASSVPSYNPSPDPYKSLIKRALRLVTGHGRPSAREQALAQLVASTKAELDEARRRASIGSAGDETPLPITQVMRSPKGTDRRVIVHYDGMVISAVLHPLGKRNVDRESEVWRCLRDQAIRVREQRR